MATRPVEARIDRLAGLSDRALPLRLTRIECPKLINVDPSERAVMKRRLGYTRVTSEMYKNASLKLDGVNDYVRIRHQTAQNPATGQEWYVGIGVRMTSFPTSTATVVSKGFNTNVNHNYHIYYDPTLNSNNGGWRGRAWSADTVTYLNLSVNDGDALNVPMGSYRFIELYLIGTTLTLKVWKYDGTVVGTATDASFGNAALTNTDDIVVGVSMSAAATIGSDFFPGSVCEFRIFKGAVGTVTSRIATSGNLYYKQEIPDYSISNFTGYWRMNDGTTTNTVADSTSTANHGEIPSNPAAWVSTSSLVIGQSALQFRGTNSFVYLEDKATAAIISNPFTTTAAGQAARWSVRWCVVPQLAPGESTVRDGVITWAGTDTAIPQPIGLRIVSNQWEATYRDGGSTVTLTLGGSAAPTTLANLRVRVALSRYSAGASTFGFVVLQVAWKDGSGNYQTSSTVSANLASATSTASRHWFLGRHVTSTTIPHTFHTDGGFYGIIDDFQVIWCNSVSPGAIIGTGWINQPANIFAEILHWSPYKANNLTLCYLKMNEGAGNILQVHSEVGGDFVARLLPETDDGAHWDEGLVVPYRAPEAWMLAPYDRVLADGSTKRTALIGHGCCLSEVDVTTGAAAIVATNIPKGTRGTHSQYAQQKFIGLDNGRRPIVYDGASCRNLGIMAPVSAPVIGLGAVGGETWTDGATYHAYVTYRNKNNGEESNPSPSTSFSPSSGQGVVTVTIPVSADPQVNQRRLYVTIANAGDGSTAYLLKEFDDNSQVTWGAATSPFTLTGIAAPVTSGTEISEDDGYFNRREAPQGGLVKVFKDTLFCAGNQVNPTRLYRSDVGAPGYWNWSADPTVEGDYVDLDLDSGDPITALATTLDRVLVGLRDGAAAVWNTGDTAQPIGFQIISKDHGPVGPHAVTSNSYVVHYVSERDIFRTDGSNEENISSPAREDFPSIQNFLRDEVEPTRRRFIVAAEYRNKKQLWFAFTPMDGTRNTRTLIYQADLGIWSLYALQLDVVCELEDGNDDPVLYGIVEGYLVKLDHGHNDGMSPVRGLVTSATDSPPIVNVSGTPFTGLTLHGHKAHIYIKENHQVREAMIYSNSSSAITLYSVADVDVDDDGGIDVAAGDLVIVGGITCFADFIIDFGDPIAYKRLQSVRAAVLSQSDTSKLRVQWKPHDIGRTPSLAFAPQSTKFIPTDLPVVRFDVGGLGNAWRVRISECDVEADMYAEDPWPMVDSELTVHEVSVRGDAILDLGA